MKNPICENCKKSLLEVGVAEVTAGTTVYDFYKFFNGSWELSSSEQSDADEVYFECGNSFCQRRLTTEQEEELRNNL